MNDIEITKKKIGGWIELMLDHKYFVVELENGSEIYANTFECGPNYVTLYIEKVGEKLTVGKISWFIIKDIEKVYEEDKK